MGPTVTTSTASNDSKKTSKLLIVDDDEKWTDLAEQKDETPSPPKTSQPIMPQPVSGAFSGPFASPPLPSRPFGPPQFGGPTVPPMTHDLYGRPLQNEAQTLETQLVNLGEVQLGLATAVSILESHILPDANFPKVREITTVSYPNDSVSRLNFRSSLLSGERHVSSTMLRDMGVLIGLKRAVKILQDAADDKDLVNVTYKLTLVQPPAPPVPIMHGPQPFGMFQEVEFRNIAKDILKDTVREYKEEIAKANAQEIQKEMIKLCRDALAKD